MNDDTGTTSHFNPKIQIDSTTGKIGTPDRTRGTTPAISAAVTNVDIMIYGTVSRDVGATFQHNVRLSLAASNDDSARSGVDYGDYPGFAYFNGRLYFSAAKNSNATGTNPDGTLKAFDLVIAPATIRRADFQSREFLEK